MNDIQTVMWIPKYIDPFAIIIITLIITTFGGQDSELYEKNEQKKNSEKNNEQKVTSFALSAYIKYFDYFIFSVHAVARLFLILFFFIFQRFAICTTLYTYDIQTFWFVTAHTCWNRICRNSHTHRCQILLLNFMDKYWRWNDEVTRNRTNWNCIMKNIRRKRERNNSLVRSWSGYFYVASSWS